MSARPAHPPHCAHVCALGAVCAPLLSLGLCMPLMQVQGGHARPDLRAYRCMRLAVAAQPDASRPLHSAAGRSSRGTMRRRLSRSGARRRQRMGPWGRERHTHMQQHSGSGGVPRDARSIALCNTNRRAGLAWQCHPAPLCVGFVWPLGGMHMQWLRVAWACMCPPPPLMSPRL